MNNIDNIVDVSDILSKLTHSDDKSEVEVNELFDILSEILSNEDFNILLSKNYRELLINFLNKSEISFLKENHEKNITLLKMVFKKVINSFQFDVEKVSNESNKKENEKDSIQKETEKDSSGKENEKDSSGKENEKDSSGKESENNINDDNNIIYDPKASYGNKSDDKSSNFVLISIPLRNSLTPNQILEMFNQINKIQTN